MSQPRLMICPYCGHAQRPSDRCQDCATPFGASSRRATLDQMGPWFVRDPERPFRPGCSHETLVRLVEKGEVRKYTIVRGPTTRQLWTVARHVPGLAHLLGYCHACDAPARPDDAGCRHCGAIFGASFDRDAMGLVEGERSGATAPGRSVGFVPDSRGRVSAFAPDEELVDALRLAARPTRNGEEGRLDDRASPAPRGDAESVGAFEAPHDGTAAWHAVERSLRYELARQRALIRTLGILVLLVASLAGWLGWRAWHAVRQADLAQRAAAAAGTPGVPGAPESAVDAAVSDVERVAPAPVAELAAAPPSGGENLLAVEQELREIGAPGGGTPDQRRGRLEALQRRLESLAAQDPVRAAALRAAIEKARAQVELEAALGGGG